MSLFRFSATLIGWDPLLSRDAFDLSRVLAIDIDGVMHPEGCGSEMNFCFAANFQDIVREVDPGGRLPIVISSSWRHGDDLASIRGNFAGDIAQRIVGVTPDLPVLTPGKGKHDLGKTWQLPDGTVVDSAHREHEIRLWMAEHAPKGDWLAIDDRGSWFSKGCPHLFAVPGLYEEDGGGISVTVGIDLLQRLAQFLYVAPEPSVTHRARP